jgi:D-xylose transport system substrate-binding protein
VLVLSASILTACGGGTGVTLGKKIALLLPDTANALDIRSIFDASVTQVCSDCEVLYNVAKTDAEQQAQATKAISGGASVIVINPLQGATAAAIVAQAKAANVPVIAYDRMVLNTPDLGYFVSFDTEAAGGLEANALLTAMGTKVNPTIVELDGDAADPNNKTFKDAAGSILKGKVRLGGQYDTPGGKLDAAKTEMQTALASLNYKVDGVIAANDVIAGGAVAAMKGKVRPWPPITGQGAALAAIQRIVVGDQYMTLYMSTKAEAQAAAQLAYDLAFGVAVPPSMTNGKTVNNGSEDVQAALLTPVVVTKVNIESTVVADAFWTADDICTSQYASACAAAGIS